MQDFHDLLRATSRTFAVGIDSLPSPLREGVTLAYLVLRVSDYFEDSPTLSADRKRDALEAWAQLIEAPQGPAHADHLAVLRESVSAEDEGLPDRLAALEADAILEGLSKLPPQLLAPTREHTAATTRGMARWTLRGADFPDEAALDDYMFEVAGRVGLLLTDLFSAHSSAVRSRREELRRSAVSFGLGLQTVNVIRGLHEDPDRGWTYVPRHVLSTGTPTAAGPLPDLRGLGTEQQLAVLDFLVSKAGGHIGDALTYCRSLPRRERGIRVFCIIPALLALRTAEASRGNLRTFVEPVRISRGDVGASVRAARFLFFSNRWVERQERRARALVRPDASRPAGGLRA